MMSRPPGLYMWANERLDGKLDETLAEWKAEGLSIDKMVIRLAEHDLTVSRETVRRWFKKAAA